MNRNAAIDISRALAVMLVTMSHVSRGPWLPSHEIGNFDLFGFLQNGWIGVGIFFVISGYCMGISAKSDFRCGITTTSYVRYALKRFMRIAPPYYISIFIWVFIISVYKIAPKSIEIRDIITHLTFTHNFFMDTFFSVSGVYWSIAVEMQFYLILPFIVAFCRGAKTTIVSLFAMATLSIIIYNTDLNIIYKWGLLNYLFLFVFGWSLFTYKENISSVVKSRKVLSALVLLFIMILLYKGNGYGNHQKLYEIIASIIYGFIMVGINDKVSAIKSQFFNVLLLIGKASFSIYLYNYIYNSVMPRGSNPFGMLFMFLGTLGFGVFMYLMVEVNTERLRTYLFKKKPVTVKTSAHFDNVTH